MYFCFPAFSTNGSTSSTAILLRGSECHFHAFIIVAEILCEEIFCRRARCQRKNTCDG